MKPELEPETLKALGALADAVQKESGGDGHFTILQPRICDHCRNPEHEAFPYHVEDRQGRFWEDLCNDCFELLDCRYDMEAAKYQMAYEFVASLDDICPSSFFASGVPTRFFYSGGRLLQYDYQVIAAALDGSLKVSCDYPLKGGDAYSLTQR